MTAMLQELPLDPARLNRVGDPNRPGVKKVRRLFRWILGSDPQPTEGQMKVIRESILSGDPLADAVVAMYGQLPAGQGRKMLDQALEHGINSVEAPPEELVDLFRQVDHEPIWLDRDLIRLGCEVSYRVGISGELVLRNMSLMGGYLAGAAAKPLVFTGQLDRMANRRLVETGKFWMDVTTPGGLERDQEGFKSAVRVRLMHAQVRNMLLKSDNWDMRWGYPLNQWDSMGTILEFSVIFLTGLRSLGYLFSRREREAVVHLWRYVGYLMGVDERILPTNEQDSMRALYHLIATIGQSDEDTRRLGEALGNASLQNREGWLQENLGKLEYTLRAGYSRYILGDEAADKLGLPRTLTKYFWPAQAPLRMSAELVRKATPGANKALMWLGEKARKSQFPEQVKKLKADTTFTPVKKLFR
ncbi:oxygenase MpaB family protein [Alcanivorax sp. DP30]|uniref:oxygenase MpaB family protein n=1 Tax=Alcanivorax sp. DP30 TaxID=2606217 RepID=UPI001370BF52|nr:oxygenase MpaB family protein [Alcanivorax sp. DP30]MZR63233.1 DUF2236 domain-containing protein [Alcanivorax sp. DP30]